MKFSPLVLLTTLFCYPVLAKVDCEQLQNRTYSASVIRVSDGDTATVKLKNTQEVSVRFYGVDTPESAWRGHWPKQAHSSEAKEFTNLLMNKSVQVIFSGDETYNRCVGEIFVNNISHSLSLVEKGHAWWYSKYAQDRSDLKAAQIKAKNSKVGLWANPKHKAPWNFRRYYQCIYKIC